MKPVVTQLKVNRRKKWGSPDPPPPPANLNPKKM